MTTITLSGISIYPIKSSAGQRLEKSAVEARGLAGDRRWMVVDAGGRFLSARQLPRLTLIQVTATGDGLVLSAPGMTPMAIAKPDASIDASAVLVWKDQVPVRDAGSDAATWLSQFLGCKVGLVYMADEHLRPVDPAYSRAGDIVSFADGFPLLLISEASLADLNARLERKVSMAHFRPNLVITGCGAYAEDLWRRVRVGGVEFDLVKACSRCVFTTIDPEKGEKSPDGEPLRTLAKYRRNENGKVLFGVNMITRSSGQVSRGDLLTVVD